MRAGRRLLALAMLVSGLAGGLSPGAAFAEETPTVAEAEQARGAILITGTRLERREVVAPYAVSVIDLEELERRSPRTVPEALQQLPGVLVQKTASGHGSPFIRGFTGNRTLLVIDGIRYNNATYRDGANEYFAQVDAFTLDQIELIAGPSSSLYGSEAVGGVINLTTRSSAVFENEGSFAGGQQTLRVSSGDHSVTSRTAFDVGEGEEWGLRGGVTVRDYGDVRAAQFGRLPETGYSEQAVDARFDLVLTPRWTATVNHQSLWQNDVPRTHSTVFSVPFAGTVAGTDLLREKDHRRNLTYARLSGEVDSAAMNALELTFSHQSRREDEVRVREDLLEIDQSFTSDLFALSAVANADFENVALTYGIDLSREMIDSARTDFDPVTRTATQRVQGPVGDDARYDQAGLFVHGIVELDDAFSLEGSLRASFIGADVGSFADPVTGEAIAFSDNWFDLSGSLRAMYSAKDSQIWAAYSRSFRAPNIADISRFGRSRSSEIEVASLDLSQERFDTFEFGYRYDAAALSLGANLFTTAMSDYIATVPTGEVRDGLTEVAKRNAASGRVSGVELLAEAQLTPRLSLQGNATWLRGRLTTPQVGGPMREPLSRIQPLSGNLALAWEKDGTWASLEMAIFSRADELSAGDLADVERIPPGGTPGYALINLRAGMDVTPNLSLTAKVSNLLDEAYRAHGSGSNEAGRHVTLSAQLRF